MHASTPEAKLLSGTLIIYNTGNKGIFFVPVYSKFSLSYFVMWKVQEKQK
jgi:hypothetical protein